MEIQAVPVIANVPLTIQECELIMAMVKQGTFPGALARLLVSIEDKVMESAKLAVSPPAPLRIVKPLPAEEAPNDDAPAS